MSPFPLPPRPFTEEEFYDLGSQPGARIWRFWNWLTDALSRH